MLYRKLFASQMFDGKVLMDDAVLVIKADGTVEDIIKKSEAGDDVEILQGILTPGLINCHCHLELSHMKDFIPAKTGLIQFLKTVVTSRNNEGEETILKKIEEAEAEMYHNGIVGVADISNTSNTIQTKKKSNIRWHNLVEVINLFDRTLPDRLAFNNNLKQAFTNVLGGAVLTPHAPYTVSEATFKAINDASANNIISIHNQESVAEDVLFKKGDGGFLELYSALGISDSPIIASGKSSLQTYLPYFNKRQTLLLVHNTFTTEEDVLFAKTYAEANFLKIVYCLCPNANLYIENALPPVDILLQHGCNIVLGTDSYSSNWSLNIAKEIQTVLKNFPHISLEEVLRWATTNGAAAMGWNDLGQFKKGLKPGLVLLGFNYHLQTLTGEAERIL